MTPAAELDRLEADPEVAAALAVADGSLEPNSEARDALVALYCTLEREHVIALLRRRGYRDAVRFAVRMYRVVDEHERELAHERPTARTPRPIARVGARARQSRRRRTRSSSRAGPGDPDDPEPPRGRHPSTRAAA